MEKEIRSDSGESRPKKNLCVDMIRTVTTMLILLHHFSGLVHGSHGSRHSFVNFLFHSGGEIGVTVFFIISGFGIFNSLENSFAAGKFSFSGYIEKRIQRLSPAYYIGLLAVLLLGDGAYLVRKEDFLNLASQLFFIRVQLPVVWGTVIGTAWFLDTLFCLYLVAPAVYLCFRKLERIGILSVLAIMLGGVCLPCCLNS